MTDRRRLPWNGTHALDHLRGQVEAAAFTAGTPASIIAPSAPLCAAPNEGLSKDLIYGEPVRVIQRGEAHSFVQSERDGYVGYTATAALGPAAQPTHRITARASHAYDRADFKSSARAMLSFGSLVTQTDQQGRFAQTELGFVPLQHLHPISQTGLDPVALAEQFLGTPYLWGGNTAWGIDCSGLVQAVLQAVGLNCPRDSDMIREEFGTLLDEGTPKQRGDVILWQGHVGILRDEHTLLHANAFHMVVASEPLEAAISRIGQNEFGAVLGYKRA